MMEAPTPTVPTDNLYKFVALSGLATLLFLVWYFSARLKVLESKQGTLSGEITALELQVKFSEQDATNILAEASMLKQKWEDNIRHLEAITNPTDLQEQCLGNFARVVRYDSNDGELR